MFWWQCLHRWTLGTVRKHLLFLRKCFQMEMTAVIATASIFYTFSTLYFQGEHTPLQGNYTKVWSRFWITARAHSSICRGGGWQSPDLPGCCSLNPIDDLGQVSTAFPRREERRREGEKEGGGGEGPGGGGRRGRQRIWEFSSLASQSWLTRDFLSLS